MAGSGGRPPTTTSRRVSEAGNELGIGTGTELGSDTGELGSDVAPKCATDVGVNLDAEMVPSRSRKSNPSPRMDTS